MTKQPLTIGMRVVPSEYGRKCMPRLTPGVVVGINQTASGTMVTAKLDGGALTFYCEGSTTYYHESVWQPEQGPAFTITVMPYSYSVSTPAVDLYADLTKDLGAQWGEGPGRHGRGMRAQDRKYWCAHLRFLVARSEQERRAREPSVGWDPYGDE